MDLKIIPASSEVKPSVEDGRQLTEASALQQIRQLDFIDKNATVTPLSKVAKR